MKNERTIEYREKKSKEIANTAAIVGGLGVGVAFCCMIFFYMGDMPRAFFALGWCALLHYHANTLVDRSYRLKGY